MQFHEPFLMWRALKKIDKEEFRHTSWEKFYSERIAYALAHKNEFVDRGHTYGSEAQSLSSEAHWLKEGCPYYKIWPGVFDQFVSTRMDIDTKFLKPPHKTFSICFPKIDKPLLSFKVHDAYFSVTSITVEHYDPEEVNYSRDKGIMLKSLKEVFKDDIFSKLEIDEYNTGLIKIRIEFQSDEFQDRYLTGEDIPDEMKKKFKGINPPSQFFRNVPIVPDKTIEEVVGDFVDIQAYDDASPEEVLPASIIEACFRVVVGIYFVSTGSQKVLEYDVITKHLNAYQKMREEGNKEKIKEYEDKAKKKGKYGWNVGSERVDRHLILPKGMTYDEALKEAGSREHLYQHTRGGHWHLYWVGSKGSQKPIVKWVEETTVKPDLPIRPIKR
jgi:hypothetical protein